MYLSVLTHPCLVEKRIFWIVSYIYKTWSGIGNIGVHALVASGLVTPFQTLQFYATINIIQHGIHWSHWRDHFSEPSNFWPCKPRFVALGHRGGHGPTLRQQAWDQAAWVLAWCQDPQNFEGHHRSSSDNSSGRLCSSMAAAHGKKVGVTIRPAAVHVFKFLPQHCRLLESQLATHAEGSDQKAWSAMPSSDSSHGRPVHALQWACLGISAQAFCFVFELQHKGCAVHLWGWLWIFGVGRGRGWGRQWASRRG